MPGDAEAQRFKAAFEKGEQLYQQGDYGAAIYNFKRADAQRVTPEVAYDLAKSYEKMGDIAFTLFYYRLYMRRAPSAPDTLEVAERVGVTLSRMEAAGRGFLELEAPRASWVTVSGKKFVEPPVAMLLAPGEYDIEADFPSGPKKMVVQVRTGKTTTISFEPVRPPLLTVESALPKELLAAGVSSAPSDVNGKRIGSLVLAGVGVAALVVGGLLGVASVSEAKTSANKTLTVSQAQTLAKSASGKAITANVLFGAGGAVVAGATVLFVFSLPEPGMPKSGGGK